MNTRIISRLLLAVSLVVTVPLASCGEQKPPALSAPDHTYTVRAKLLAKPTAKSYLQLHHEEIKTFENKDGKVVGMREMAMEFADLSEGAARSLDVLGVGDAVEVTFEVRWSSDPRMLVTAIRRLHEGETLELKKTLGPE